MTDRIRTISEWNGQVRVPAGLAYAAACYAGTEKFHLTYGVPAGVRLFLETHGYACRSDGMWCPTEETSELTEPARLARRLTEVVGAMADTSEDFRRIAEQLLAEYTL